MIFIDPVEGKHDPLIFLHFPHTGGSFVTSVLAGLRTARQPEGQHVPVWKLKNWARSKATVFTVTRAPPPWYAGCIDYALRIHNGEVGVIKFADGFHMDALADSIDIYSGGTFDRSDILYGLTHMDELGDELPPKVGLTWGEVYPRAALTAGAGLWTWCMHWFLAPLEIEGEQRRTVDLFLSTENLTNGLASLLGEVPATITPFLNYANRRLRTAVPWTQEELGWIARADGEMASGWGYNLLGAQGAQGAQEVA